MKKLLLICLLLTGCCEGEAVDLGIIKQVEIKTNSWNAADIQVITTDRMVVSITRRIERIPIGGHLYYLKGTCIGSEYEVRM